MSGSSYLLDGDASELRQHVNQQVQISGSLDTMSGGGSNAMTGSGAASAGTAGGGTSPGATTGGGTGASSSGTMQSSTGAQRLRVESVQMIAANCSQQ
jgi:hypothetical protein